MKYYYRCNNNYTSSSSGHLGRGYCFFISWQDAQELTFWLVGFWMYKHIGLILYHWQSTGLAAMCWTFCSRLFAKYFMQNSGLSETGFIAFSQSPIISCCELCDANGGVGMYIWPWKQTKTRLSLFNWLLFPLIPVASVHVVYCWRPEMV